jgi:hypothetical protein
MVFLVLAVITLTFCSGRKKGTPEGLYTEEQMAVYLKDIYLIQEQVKNLRLGPDSTEVIYKYYEQQLYEKHNIDDSIYRESFKYYVDDVKGLATIYEIIADSLSLEERILENKRIYDEEDLKEMEID